MKFIIITYEELEDILNDDAESNETINSFMDMFNVQFALSLGYGISVDTYEDYSILQDQEMIAIKEDGSMWFRLENWQRNIVTGETYFN